tara:strand:- start:1108 stop:2037 length:930 start_codon:yes stop_codon:yes gene_type:complete
MSLLNQICRQKTKIQLPNEIDQIIGQYIEVSQNRDKINKLFDIVPRPSIISKWMKGCHKTIKEIRDDLKDEKIRFERKHGSWRMKKWVPDGTGKNDRKKKMDILRNLISLKMRNEIQVKSAILEKDHIRNHNWVRKERYGRDGNLLPRKQWHIVPFKMPRIQSFEEIKEHLINTLMCSDIFAEYATKEMPDGTSWMKMPAYILGEGVGKIASRIHQEEDHKAKMVSMRGYNGTLWQPNHDPGLRSDRVKQIEKMRFEYDNHMYKLHIPYSSSGEGNVYGLYTYPEGEDNGERCRRSQKDHDNLFRLANE